MSSCRCKHKAKITSSDGRNQWGEPCASGKPIFNDSVEQNSMKTFASMWSKAQSPGLLFYSSGKNKRHSHWMPWVFCNLSPLAATIHLSGHWKLVPAVSCFGLPNSSLRYALLHGVPAGHFQHILLGHGWDWGPMAGMWRWRNRDGISANSLPSGNFKQPWKMIHL